MHSVLFKWQNCVKSLLWTCNGCGALKNGKNLAEVFKNASRVLVNEGYIEAATSDNTRMAYQSDINHFEKFGGDLPTDPNAIEQYLKESTAPTKNAEEKSMGVISINNYRWKKHARGLFDLPIAA